MLDFILLTLDRARTLRLCDLLFGLDLLLAKAWTHTLRNRASLLLLESALEEGVSEPARLHGFLKSTELLPLLDLIDLIEHVSKWIILLFDSAWLLLFTLLRGGFGWLTGHQGHSDSVTLQQSLHVFDVCCQGQVLCFHMHHVINQD